MKSMCRSSSCGCSSKATAARVDASTVVWTGRWLASLWRIRLILASTISLLPRWGGTLYRNLHISGNPTCRSEVCERPDSTPAVSGSKDGPVASHAASFDTPLPREPVGGGVCRAEREKSAPGGEQYPSGKTCAHAGVAHAYMPSLTGVRILPGWLL